MRARTRSDLRGESAPAVAKGQCVMWCRTRDTGRSTWYSPSVMDLKDRVALVAGGTGLLGTAIARALAGAGADIAITYLERADAARETVGAVEVLGRKAWSVALDQTKPEAIPPAVDAVVKQFGRLDILVNNAAWNISIPFPDLER